MNTKVLTDFGPWLTIALIAVLAWAVAITTQTPPSAVAVTAPAQMFSGQRALNNLTQLLAENKPHPAGSQQNKIIKNRIVEHLAQIGYNSEIQQDFSCSILAPSCATVENIISVIQGNQPQQPAILVTAHYDSVPGSAGAADDMAAVAAMLEIASNLKASAKLQNDVILLFSDAEETGLRGAMSFANKHPLMNKVGLVLNMEARGFTGPSSMFETGANNLQLIKGYQQASKQPSSSSLVVEIYRRMPNGSDYSIYQMRGIAGLNFGFSNGASIYHSVLDDVAHLDPGSLQHHGDNVLGALQVFGNMDLQNLSSEQNATYFDMFSHLLISWPDSWGPYLALFSLLGLVMGMRYFAQTSLTQIGYAVTGIVLAITILVSAGWILSYPLGQFGSIHPLDHPYPWPARISLIVSAILAASLSTQLIKSQTNYTALFFSTWSLYALMGLLLALVFSAGAYIFIVPSVVVGLSLPILSLIRPTKALIWSNSLGLMFAAYMAFYHFYLFDVVFNFHLSYLKVLSLILLTLPLMALVGHWQATRNTQLKAVSNTLTALLLSTALLAYGVPAFNSDRPRPVNLVYHSDHANQTQQWEIRSSSAADTVFLQQAGFDLDEKPLQRYGALDTRSHLKKAADLQLPPPILAISKQWVEGENLVIQGTIASQRDAYIVGFSFAQNQHIKSLKIADQWVLNRDQKAITQPQFVRINGVGNQAINFTLALQGKQLSGAAIFDMANLPSSSEGLAIQQLRPSNAAPLHYGDYSVVVDRFTLPTLTEPNYARK